MAAEPTTIWQVAQLVISGASALGIAGIIYRMGIYTQKVDGHAVQLVDHDKRIAVVGDHDKCIAVLSNRSDHQDRILTEHGNHLARHDAEVGVLQQKWSSVSHLP